VSGDAMIDASHGNTEAEPLRATKAVLEAWRFSEGAATLYDNISDVLGLLGCPRIAMDPVKRVRELQIPLTLSEPTDDIGQSLRLLLKESIVGVFGLAAEPSSLLAGMYRNGLWQSCLGTEDDTYYLACALLYSVEAFVVSSSLDVHTSADVLAIINIWLNPSIAWESLPSGYVLAGALFGETWCTIVLGDVGEGESRDILGCVLRERPPLLPWLCPSKPKLVDMELPYMEGAP
jgi:hypothetical protein